MNFDYVGCSGKYNQPYVWIFTWAINSSREAPSGAHNWMSVTHRMSRIPIHVQNRKQHIEENHIFCKSLHFVFGDTDFWLYIYFYLYLKLFSSLIIIYEK